MIDKKLVVGELVVGEMEVNGNMLHARVESTTGTYMRSSYIVMLNSTNGGNYDLKE